MATKMTDYLVEKARNQIWCNPLQDNQSIWLPKRVTVGDGAQGYAFVLGREVTLPWEKQRAHVFQVGQISPALLGLLETNPAWQKETWFNVAETMSILPLYMNIYNENGVNIPRKHVYYMYTREKCLIFAVRVDERIHVNLDVDNVYFRMYTSAYLRRENPPVTLPVVQVGSYEVNQFSDIANLRAQYLAAKARAGHTEAFVNGFLVNDLNVSTVNVGDVVEWIYEAAVKRMVTWTVKDLKNFNSTMDRKYKYILHYPKAEQVNQIDFDDDIDLYIQYRNPAGNTQGYYYLKNQRDAMRMLTHRDYSIVGDYVDFISRALAKDLGQEIPDLLQYEIVAKIREGGYNRALIKDSNRIFELYKLTDNRILMAMTGIDAMVPVWAAEHLEAAAYPEVMGVLFEHEVTPVNTEKAYGYNTISRILADTPQKTRMIGAQPVVDLPYEVSVDSTAYEYDAQGRLLAFHYHTNDDTYDAREPNCRLVEMLVGRGDAQSSVKMGKTNLALPAVGDWRLYQTLMDPSNPGVWIGGWEDITDDTTKYSIQNGQVVWTGADIGQYLMLRTNEKFLAYNFDLTQADGVLMFSLSEYTTIEGVTALRPMVVPMGDLQIFLNGYNLVQGIDYTVNFPNVCLNAQKFVQQGANPDQLLPQRIHVRFTGFCDADLKMWKPKDTGFVVDGVLSANRRYDALDDKVLHISLGGAVMAREDVKFFENHPDFNPISPLNGQPYQIKPIIVPLKDFTLSGTYPLLRDARAVDKQVEAYMQLYWDKPTAPLSAAYNRWRLTSPFISCMVDLCVRNRLTWEPTKLFSDQEVIEICRPFESLLSFDPIGHDFPLPEAYVNITPTRYDQSVNVERVQFRFLTAVVRIYGKGLVSLNNFVTFTVN